MSVITWSETDGQWTATRSGFVANAEEVDEGECVWWVAGPDGDTVADGETETLEEAMSEAAASLAGASR